MLKKLLILLLLVTATIHGMDQRLYKYPDAKNDYVKASKDKDQSAAFQLALFYKTELQDYDKAIEWYKIAYSYGSERSAFNLGLIYHKQKNYDEALKWYKEAYKNNDIKSAYNLGLLYEETYKDNKKAIKWYKKAYKQGNMAGANNLGYLYDVTLKDQAQGIYWYKKGAQGGNTDAINNLNKVYYEKGDLVTSSAYVLAMAYYDNAKQEILNFLKNERKIDRKTLEKAYKLQQTLDIPKHYTGGID